MSKRREWYAEYLQTTAKRMQDLASRLAEYGEPATKEDKQLIRLACEPAVSEMMKEVQTAFMLGYDANENPSMTELTEMFADLHD